MGTPRPLPQVVGDFVRAHRRAHKITKDDLALAGSNYGMSWGRTSIDNIESGRSAITIPTLYALCGALSQCGRGHVTLDDIIRDDETIVLAESLVRRGDELKAFLASEPILHSVGDTIDSTIQSLTRPPSYTLAERRAASTLGVDASELVRLAFERWGDRLDTVITHSVGRDANPQKRGHETRRRVMELRSQMSGDEDG